MIALRELRFRPPLWAWLLAAWAMFLFGSLGVWQVHRGEFKAQWRAQLTQPKPPVRLSAASTAPAEPAVEHVVATGHYQSARTLLQDGQSHDGQPGYHVWTPLLLAAGGVVMVDRGWIPLGNHGVSLAEVAAPAGRAQVQGFWRSLPKPGMRVGGDKTCEAAREFPALVLYPTAQDLKCLLGQPVMDGLLLLDPAAPGGFVRAWATSGLPPERHYAYAAQWFALAATAAILFVVLNLKRSR
jgi:surfeit locus 1 family protein